MRVVVVAESKHDTSKELGNSVIITFTLSNETGLYFVD